jgi:hypothetical protein
MRDHWGHTIGEEPTDKAANDLTRRELRDLMSDAVYRGALKAIGVYLLISALVWFILKLIAFATASSS